MDMPRLIFVLCSLFALGDRKLASDSFQVVKE
jgi:hypothetical protein